jgi:hypothetical protein
MISAMPRHRIHENVAARMRAYRERLRVRLAGQASPEATPRRPRSASRPARLAAIERELEVLAEEYRAWRENMPETLGESELASRLEETIEQLEAALEAVQEIDPPRGFGR